MGVDFEPQYKHFFKLPFESVCCLLCLLLCSPLEGSLLGSDADNLGDGTTSDPLLLFPDMIVSMCMSDVALTDVALAEPSKWESGHCYEPFARSN
jgi:hypothetical protein